MSLQATRRLAGRGSQEASQALPLVIGLVSEVERLQAELRFHRGL